MSAILERTLAPAEHRVVVEFANRVRARFGDRLSRLLLFGSRARGDVTEESDIDLLVLLRLPVAEETRATREVWEIVEGVLRLERDAYIPLAPIVFAEERFLELKRLERSFALDVEAEGIALCRTRAATASALLVPPAPHRRSLGPRDPLSFPFGGPRKLLARPRGQGA